MKILQVTDLYPPVKGGLELAVQSLSRGLAVRGHEVTVVTQSVGDQEGRSFESGVDVHRLPTWSQRLLGPLYRDRGYPLLPPAPEPGFMSSLRRVIGELRPDVVHAHGWSAYSVLALRRLEAPVVVGLHDYGHVCPKRTLTRVDGSLCAGPRLVSCPGCASSELGAVKGTAISLGLSAASALHRKAAGFVANSRAVLRATSPWLPRQVPAVVIPPPACSPPPGAPRPSFLPPDDGYVLFVGALSAHKGVEVLLEAYAAAGLDRELVIVATRRQGHISPMQGPVTLVEGAAHEEVLSAFAHCSFAVVPSRWPEPFGLVAAEAMAAGKPVIASAIGGLEEIVEDGVSGLLVPPGDAAALAAGLRELAGDGDRLREMGRAAANRALLWHPDATSIRVEDFYRTLVAKGEAA